MYYIYIYVDEEFIKIIIIIKLKRITSLILESTVTCMATLQRSGDLDTRGRLISTLRGYRDTKRERQKIKGRGSE